MTIYATLESSDDLASDIEWLCKIEPRFEHAYRETGPIELRTRKDGYASLIRTIIGQQVSVASAEAIWGRLHSAGLIDLASIKSQSEASLRELGLSRQKASYLLSLANADIDFATLPLRDDQQVIDILTSVKGIGLWSAEIYLMFSLRRADVTAAGDLALQEAARILFELDNRPSEKDFRALSQNWSPYRNAASQLLWAYYHIVKGRVGV